MDLTLDVAAHTLRGSRSLSGWARASFDDHRGSHSVATAYHARRRAKLPAAPVDAAASDFGRDETELFVAAPAVIPEVAVRRNLREAELYYPAR
jgi:hypothetical protein